MVLKTPAVVVLGAGAAGLAAAIMLRRLEVGPVVVLDRPTRLPAPGETVLPDLLVWLGRLGLREEFLRGPHRRVPGLTSLWGSAVPSTRDFLWHPLGEGWRLDRRVFDQMLRVAAVRAGAAVLTAAGPSGGSIQRGSGAEQAWSVVSADGTTRVEAPFAIDASGPGARIARSLGIRRSAGDRLVALSRRSEARIGTWHSVVEATSVGWWYAADLPDAGAQVTLFTDPSTIKSLGVAGAWRSARGEDEMLAGVIPDAPSRGPGSGQVVTSGVLEQCVGASWCAVGDAGWSADPIFGHGITAAVASGVWGALYAKARLHGDSEAARKFSARLHNRSAGYEEQRHHLYEMERRWENAPFWRRRLLRAAGLLVRLRHRRIRRSAGRAASAPRHAGTEEGSLRCAEGAPAVTMAPSETAEAPGRGVRRSLATPADRRRAEAVPAGIPDTCHGVKS